MTTQPEPEPVDPDPILAPVDDSHPFHYDYVHAVLDAHGARTS